MPSRKARRSKAASKRKLEITSGSVSKGEDLSIRQRPELAESSLSGNHVEPSILSNINNDDARSSEDTSVLTVSATSQEGAPSEAMPSGSSPYYPLTTNHDDPGDQRKICFGKRSAVFNLAALKIGWNAALKELGIDKTMDELSLVLSEVEMEELWRTIKSTKAHRHMMDYFKEASDKVEDCESLFDGIPESLWDIPEDFCCL